MKRKYLLASLLAVGAIATGTAQAAITYYDLGDSNQWALQTTATRLDDFNDGSLQNAGGTSLTANTTQVVGVGLSYNGVGVPGTSPSNINYAANATMYLVDSSFSQGVTGAAVQYVIGSGGIGGGNDNGLFVEGNDLLITYNGPASNSFGMDLLYSQAWGVNATQTPVPFTVTLNGGALGAVTYGTNGYDGLAGNPIASFFGAIASAPITSILISSPSAMFSIDNVRFGTAAVATPEPSTMALLGLGLAALGWKARRKAAV